MKTNLWKLIVGFGIAAVVLGATLPDPYTSYNDNLVVRTNATVRNALKFGTSTNEWSTSSGTNLTVSGATYPSFVQTTNRLGVTPTGLAVMQAANVAAGRIAVGAQPTSSYLSNWANLNSYSGFGAVPVYGMSMFLDSRSLRSIADGAAIASWTDIGPKTNTASQGTAGNQPLKNSITNGSAIFAYMQAPGSSNRTLVTTSQFDSSFDKSFTYIVVKRAPILSINVDASVSGTSFYDGNSVDQLFNTGHLSPTQLTVKQNGGGIHWQVWTFKYDGATAIVRLNGTQVSSVATTGTLQLSGAMTIGALSTGGFQSTQDIVAMLAYSVVLTDAECLGIEYYLGSKIGQVGIDPLIFDGDSLTFGTGSTAGNDYPSQTIALQTYPWFKFNQGLGGTTTTNMLAGEAASIATFPAPNRKAVVFWGGNNDLYYNGTGTNTYLSVSNYCTVARASGFKVVVLTITPRSNGGTPAGFESERQILNGLIRTNYSGFADALADIGANGTIGQAGDENNVTYYGDKVHLTNAGYAIVAGLVNTALNSITW